MADVLVLEFESPRARDLYEQVNGILGIDASSGAGDWPSGLESHVAGELGGKLIVVEVWSTRSTQESFMEGRLAPALEQAGAPRPARVEWFDLVGRKTS